MDIQTTINEAKTKITRTLNTAQYGVGLAINELATHLITIYQERCEHIEELKLGLITKLRNLDGTLATAPTEGVDAQINVIVKDDDIYCMSDSGVINLNLKLDDLRDEDLQLLAMIIYKLEYLVNAMSNSDPAELLGIAFAQEQTNDNEQQSSHSNTSQQPAEPTSGTSSS